MQSVQTQIKKMHSKTYGSTKNKSHNKFRFEDSEKIRLMTEELVGSSKQLTLWIIGFSVALGVSVVFIITTCILTILR